MKKSIAMLGVLVVLLVGHDARAFFYTVTGTADNTDAVTHGGIGTVGSPFQMSSLRGATLHANTNSGPHTIMLPAGTYLLTIPGNVTNAGSGEGYSGNAAIGDLDIRANNTTLQGAAAATTIIRQTTSTNSIPSNDRVIEVNPTLLPNFNFTLQDVTILGGKTPDGGGGLVCGSSNNLTTVRRCIFNGNQTFGTASAGGAIDCLGGGALIVDGCVFTNNTAITDNGGAIDFFADPATGTLTITNSAFRNNSAGANGGALDVAGTLSGFSSITTCTFLTNNAGNQGGAIAIPATGALSISFNRLVGNTAATAANGKALTRSGLSTLNSSNNWWGLSTGPAANDVVGTSVGVWLKLTHYASPSAINFGVAASLSATFTTNSAGTFIPVSNLAVLIGLPITFGNAVKGTISSPQTVIQANGTATATFTAGNVPGAASADAGVDGGVSTAAITILCPVLSGNVSGGGTICAGNSATVTASISGGTPPYTVSLNNGGGTQMGSSPLSFAVSPASTTTYAASSATDTYGCPVTMSGSALVTVNPSPSPAITLVPANVCASSFGNEASGPPGLASYAWTIANGIITSATNLPSITYAAGASGNVTLGLTVFNAIGCGGSVVSNVAIVIPATPLITSEGCSFRLSYFAHQTFTDGLFPTTAGIAFDGTNFWSCSGGGSGGVRLARYNSSGSLLGTYSPGLDFRSVFTDKNGTVLARAFDDPTIYRQSSPGVFVNSGVTLGGGNLGPQSSVVLNGAGTEYIAMNAGVVSRWSTNGTYLGSVTLQGFGLAGGENVFPQNRGIASVGGFWLTYNTNRVLSVWDTAGNRIMQSTLLLAGTNFDSAFGFSYCAGKVLIDDDAGGLWRAYDVCSGERVAVYGAPAVAAWNTDVQNKILGTGTIPQLDPYLITAGNPVPTLTDLRRYSAVLTYSDSNFNGNTNLGNALADYVDQGGGVVLATFAFHNSGAVSIQGRLLTGGYLPFTTGMQSGASGLTLIPDLPIHSILAGVAAFNGGNAGFHNSPISIAGGAALVAHWSNGQPLVGTREVTPGRVVGLNFYPPSSDARSDFWQASTDGDQLLANALLWAGKSPPTILSNPAPQIGAVGSLVGFSVAAVGTQPLSYQWRRDGINLAGQTASSLIVEVQPSNVGNYSVVVSNAYGLAFSSSAALGSKLRFFPLGAPQTGLLSLVLGSSDNCPLTPERAGRVRIYASTNVALPFSGWTQLSNTLTLTNGVLRVSGIGAVVPPARFFRAVETP